MHSSDKFSDAALIQDCIDRSLSIHFTLRFTGDLSPLRRPSIQLRSVQWTDERTAFPFLPPLRAVGHTARFFARFCHRRSVAVAAYPDAQTDNASRTYTQSQRERWSDCDWNLRNHSDAATGRSNGVTNVIDFDQTSNSRHRYQTTPHWG